MTIFYYKVFNKSWCLQDQRQQLSTSDISKVKRIRKKQKVDEATLVAGKIYLLY